MPAGRGLENVASEAFRFAPAVLAAESVRFQSNVSVAAEIAIDFPSFTSVSTTFLEMILLKEAMMRIKL